jgi:hypothetical protein
MMTVRELVKALKRMPPGAGVGWKDHDHGSDEWNGPVNRVLEVEDEEKELLARGVGVILST